MLPFTLASAPLPLSYAVEEAPAPAVPEIQFFSGGRDLSDMVQLRSLSGSEELNLRGTLDVRLFDSTGNLRIEIGEPVRLLYRGEPLFAGTVDDAEEETPDAAAGLWVRISAVDYNQLLDRHVVSAIFESMTLRDIVLGIVNTYSGEIGERLADAGISYTATSIQTGPTLGRIKFTRRRASACLSDLCELVGFAWWVDSSRVLWVIDPTVLEAPAPLDASVHGDWGRVRATRTRELYRNMQYIEGGQATTEPVWLEGGSPNTYARKESFYGNGKDKTFTAQLPLAAKPRIFVNSLEVSQADIAIREQDEEAEWQYAVGEKEITQNSDSDFSPVGDGVLLEVIYQGFYPIVQVARDDGEIDERASIEGGVGIYTEVESEPELDSEDLARELAQALLRRHGHIPQRLACRTTTHGYHPGQRVSVMLPELDLVEEMLIERVSWSWLGLDPDRPFRYEVSSIAGEHQGGWADFYRRWRDAGRPYVIDENELTNWHRTFRSRLILSDTLHALPGKDLTDWSLDRYTRPILGSARLGREREDGTMAGARVGLPEEM